MSSVNKATILGNLGRDPEVRTMQNGDKVANVSIATSESWTDKRSGEKREKVEWHRVVVFGPAAEVVEKYTRKGSKLYVEGQLQTREWQDKDGEKRYTTEIVVSGFNSRIVLVGDPRNGRDASAQQESTQQAPREVGQVAGSYVRDFELNDDIPF